MNEASGAAKDKTYGFVGFTGGLVFTKEGNQLLPEGYLGVEIGDALDA